MNWDAIGAGAELLGALGVIASLVYLGSQVRSSSRQSRQAAVQSVVQQMNAVWNQMSSRSAHAEVWTKGSKGLSDVPELDALQFSALMLSIFRPYEEIYHYYSNGQVDEWMWESIGRQCEALMSTPGFADWWEMRRGWFSSDFQNHIDAVSRNLPGYTRFGQAE